MLKMGIRGLCAVAVLCAVIGCGNSPKATRVTITVDVQALGPAALASIRTIRLRVEKDLQVVEKNFSVPAGALANGRYEVIYTPLTKTGSLHVIIAALDGDGNVLATNSGDVTIKTGRNATLTVALAGTSSDALLVITPATVDFGDVVLGAPAGRMTVTLRNAGLAPTGLLLASLSGDTTAFVIDPMTTCDGLALLADETCTLAVEFRPTEAGAREARLTVSASPGGETTTSLTGAGIAASVVTLDPVVADLGAVEVGRTGPGVKFTVTNSGGQASSGVTLTIAGANAQEMKLANDGCAGKPLAAGDSCTFSMALAPTSAGPKTAIVTVTGLRALALAAGADDGATFAGAGADAPTLLALGAPGSATAALTGLGLAGAVLVVEPAAQDFGTVLAGGGSSATFSVRNAGGLATGSLAMALSGTHAAEMALAVDGCTGTVLAAGTSCAVTVDFSPTSVGTSGGTKTARLQARATPGGDAAADLTATVAAAGALTIAPANLDFGGVLVGSAGMANAFVITNTGGTPSGPLTLALGGSGAAQFSAGADGCTGQMLAAGATCSVSYAFRPTTAGNKTASLVVMGTPGGIGAAALIGKGLAPAALAANATVAFGTMDVGFTGSPYTWMLRNQGDVPTGALGVTTTGTASDFTVGNGCTVALGAGASCAISVALAPKTGGEKTITVTVTGTPGGSVTLMAAGTARPAQPLTVALAGNGAGSVTSDLPGINCGATCGAGYRHGATVTLTPTAAAGSTFAGWGGACTGTGVCAVNMTAAQNVTATFTLNRYTLSVKTSGAATGTVASVPAGIDCGADCAETYNHGAMVTLAATAAPGWEFGGWAGVCTGTGTCLVAMTQARSVTATFTQGSFALSVAVVGMGRVASTPLGIDCGSDCGEAYPSGTLVQLSASAATGHTFAAWGGACAATDASSPCTVTMSQARDVSASFTPNLHLLTVQLVGKGTGTVVSRPVGIDCDSVARAPDCSESFPYGTMVTLTAAPGTGMRIAAWTGVCERAGATCTVTVTDALTVGVAFEPQQLSLAVQKIGAAAADCTVTANVGAINCGADCEDPYPYGSTVTLTAVPVVGKTIFLGWDWPSCMTPPAGAAGPPLTCAVPITMKTIVTARFEVPVSVTTRAATGGTVTSTPAGISCGTACTASYPSNSTVTLLASPSGLLYRFSSWTGACAGQGATCTIMLGITNVSAIASFSTLVIGPPIVVDPPIVVQP